MFKLNPSTKLSLIVLSLLAINSAALAQNNLTAKANSVQPQPVSTAESDRTRDGLAGPVRRVKTEVAKLTNAGGRTGEEKRVVLETAAYDVKGVKTENQYFPVAGSALTGKEVYKYDERGNISEMTLLNSDGSLMGKEVYKYDYDSLGNWTKMTTSVAVVEGGKVTFEPTEVTYRTISYYLDENVLKAQATAPATAPATATTTAPAANPSAQPVKPEVQPTSTASQPKSQPTGKTGDNRVAANRNTGPALPAITDSNNSNSASVLSGSNTGVTSAQGTAVAVDTPPPPMNAPKPILKPVSGGVLNGKAIYLPSPTYPEAAKRMRLAGLVTIDVVVDESGKVISATASAGPAVLRDVAIQAATRAKFSPTMLSGAPVKVTGQINYKFSLSQ
jgi:protein TonB